MDLRIPSGYTTSLVGDFNTSNIEDFSVIEPLEEQAAEGSLVLMKLNFESAPSIETLSKLESDLVAAGVPKWPGNSYLVYQDTSSPSVYIAWVKGIAWMGIIIGILILTILPVLLGGLVWLLLPQSIKDMIMMMVNAGIMILMMLMMSKMMSSSMEEKPRPKQIRTRPGLTGYEEGYFTGEEV